MTTDTMAAVSAATPQSISASEIVSLVTEPSSLGFTKNANREKSNKGIYKAKHSETPTLTASIPSKYQTFFTSSNESYGFNSGATRFNSTSETENPGPGTYGSQTMKHRTESFSKKGTGGLASNSKRFPRRATHLSLGPGSYDPTMHYSHIDFNRSQCSRNFQSPIVKKSCTIITDNHSGAPAPNTYNIKRSNDQLSVAVSAFKSQSKRDGLSSTTQYNPGPGQYNPNDTALHRGVCTQRANFLSKTNRGEFLVKKNGGPGPADYTTVPETKKRSIPYYRQKHYLCISAPAIPLPSIPPPPGPGHYEMLSNKDNVKLVTGAVFKSTSSRLSQPHNNQLPGPGAYEPKVIGKRSFFYNTNHHWV